MTSCDRCVTGTAIKSSRHCRDCNQVIDRIILRAEDMTSAELGEMFGLSVEAVWQRKSRALRKQR